MLSLLLLGGLFAGGRTDGRQAKTPTLPSLDAVLGKAADKTWTRRGGEFTVERDAKLDRSILTVTKGPLVLETGETQAREIRALIRLRTDTTPNLSADFYFARKDPKDSGLRMLLTANRGVDYISCQVQQNGKAFHDPVEMSKQLDWQAEPNNSFTYYPRAYSLRDIRPGWPEDFRIRIEHDMAACRM